jgi:hypothetical protein
MNRSHLCTCSRHIHVQTERLLRRVTSSPATLHWDTQCHSRCLPLPLLPCHHYLLKHAIRPHSKLHTPGDFFAAMHQHPLLEHKYPPQFRLHIQKLFLIRRPKSRCATFQTITVIQIQMYRHETLQLWRRFWLIIQTITMRLEILTRSISKEPETMVQPSPINPGTCTGLWRGVLLCQPPKSSFSPGGTPLLPRFSCDLNPLAVGTDLCHLVQVTPDALKDHVRRFGVVTQDALAIPEVLRD